MHKHPDTNIHPYLNFKYFEENIQIFAYTHLTTSQPPHSYKLVYAQHSLLLVVIVVTNDKGQSSLFKVTL